MTDLSIAIQHTPGHADRRKWVQAMIEQLRSENPNIPITVIEDTQREGCWPTHRRALEAARGASHHLVVQDDIGLCRDFLPSVEEVIRAKPDNLISLYTNAEAVFTARERGESWVEKSGVSGPSVIWPTDLIGEFLQWQDVHINHNFPWDDVRVSMWIIKTSRQAFATVPSLTQHLGYESSALGLNDPSKVAAWYIGDNQSGLSIDWSLGLTLPAKETTRILPEWWEHFRE
jgi:hypothetical protein